MNNCGCNAYIDAKASRTYLTKNRFLKMYYLDHKFKKISEILAYNARLGNHKYYTSRTSGLMYKSTSNTIGDSFYLSNMLVKKGIHALEIAKGTSAKEIQRYLKKLTRNNIQEGKYVWESGKKCFYPVETFNEAETFKLNVIQKDSHLIDKNLFTKFLNTYRAKKIDLEYTRTPGQKFFKFFFRTIFPVALGVFLGVEIRHNLLRNDEWGDALSVAATTLPILFLRAVDSLSFRLMWHKSKFHFRTIEKALQPDAIQWLQTEPDGIKYFKDAKRSLGEENEEVFYNLFSKDVRTYLLNRTDRKIKTIRKEMHKEEMDKNTPNIKYKS